MEKFINFLNQFHTEENNPVIESIIAGYKACFESDEKEETCHEKKLTFKFRDGEHTVDQLLALFKNKQKGILILDPEGDMDIPATAFVIPEFKSKPDSYKNRFRTYEFSQYENDDEKSNMKKCEIIVKSEEKEKVDRAIDNFKQLFDEMGSIGNCGHSFSIKFVPNNNQAKIREFGWDGDGADYIDTKSIKIS